MVLELSEKDFVVRKFNRMKQNQFPNEIRFVAKATVKFALFASVLLLGSCLPLAQNPQPKYLMPPPSIEGTVQRNLESGYFTIGDWPQDDWWSIFQSPQLNDLIQEALLSNPSIDAINEKVEQAHQAVIIARSKLFPWIALDAAYDWEYLSKNGLYRALNPKLPLNTNLYDLKLTLSYELDLWGKNRQNVLAALGRQMAQEAESAQVKLMITTAVAQAYVAVKINQQRRDLVMQLITARKEIYQLQDLLNERSLASKLIAYAAEENYYGAQKTLWSIEEELAISQHLLNILVGRSPDVPLDIGENTLPPIDSLSIPCDLSLDLLARRPDLMAQIWKVEAFAHDVNAAKTEYYPDVNLRAFLGIESITAKLLFNSSSTTAGVKPAIHLPIFTAGEIQANIDTQLALFYEAMFEYNQLLLFSVQEVADRLVTAESYFKQKRDQGLLLQKVQARYALTRLRYEKGLDTQVAIDYLKEELIRQELVDLDITYAQNITMIRLIKALGGGYQSLYMPLRAGEACE